MRNKNTDKFKFQRGQLTLAVLLFGALAVIILSGLILWVDVSLRSAKRSVYRNQAFRAAEAGIEYYRWHLAHAPDDFQDGIGQPGPYVHNYYDKNGELIGKFELEITPPVNGSTVLTVRSKGTVEGVLDLEKIIEVKFGKSSFAKFAAIMNDSVYFGEGSEVFGEIHSNGGVHFDGLAHNLVTSAVAQYNDPEHSGNVEFGVHTHKSPVDPVPPSAVPERPDVFMAGRQFPVPAVDFSGISASLADIKAGAQSAGLYFGSSDQEGYNIVLKANNTFDLYRVVAVRDAPNGCISVIGQKNWGTWSIETQQLIGTYDIPANGLLFVEDNVWVEGQINGSRVIIGSGVFPENSAKYTTIVVNKDLLYSNYDGSDSIGLISQGDLLIGWESNDVLRIDAALIAQNGWVGRQYYRPPSGNQERCAPHHIKSTITVYGMIGSYQRYGFAYTDGTGYQTRNLIYDSNLYFAPPPGFPLTTDYYRQLSWTEVK